MIMTTHTKRRGRTLLLAATASLLFVNAAQASSITSFTAGDLVVSVEGNGSNTGTYLDNQAAPLTLAEFGLAGTQKATLAGTFELPQTSSNGNSAISGEYGSSSEGSIQLSGNGQYLTLMGYGVNAQSYNSQYDANGTGTALAQSSSSTVSRVVALIGANGSVNTSTALTNVFNGNNPRSAFTANGTSFLISGQGTKGDATAGVFSASLGSKTATPVTGLDSTYQGNPSSQDTRFVTQYAGQTYVSIDASAGKPNRSYIATVGSTGTLTALNGMASGTVTLNGSNGNSINRGSGKVNLSPEDFFFANSTTLYVADSGSPKNGSSLGDGGLQKWSLKGTSWVLDYTLNSGLNLVANTASAGTTGLLGLTGKIVGGSVELFATNYTIGDTDPTYLYGITDSLASTTAPNGEAFAVLAAAAVGTTFKGVSFAPTVAAVPLPGGLPLFAGALVTLGALVRRGRKSAQV